MYTTQVIFFFSNFAMNVIKCYSGDGMELTVTTEYRDSQISHFATFQPMRPIKIPTYEKVHAIYRKKSRFQTILKHEAIHFGEPKSRIRKYPRIKPNICLAKVSSEFLDV